MSAAARVVQLPARPPERVGAADRLLAWTMPSARRWLQNLALLAAASIGCQQIPFEDPTTGGGSGESESATGTGDPDPSGGGSAVPEYRCVPDDLTSCPEGQKCTALLQGNFQNLYDCVDDDTALTLYSECTPAPINGQDKCPPSTVCAPDAGEGTSGICVPLCVSDSECGNGRCIANPYSQVPVCGELCDPFTPFCPTGLECRQTTDAFACLFPTEVDVGEVTAQCLYEGDRGCSQGFVCEAGELIPSCASPTGLCCTSLCDLEAPDTCPVPATCNAAFADPAPGYAWVGACFVPT